jgi:MFS-type transporter involved in bile tolerance (Atg22 family)
MIRNAPPSAATGAERLAWSMYDFANSAYTTVVLTTVFNAYFVAVVAGGRRYLQVRPPSSGRLRLPSAMSSFCFAVP